MNAYFELPLNIFKFLNLNSEMGRDMFQLPFTSCFLWILAIIKWKFLDYIHFKVSGNPQIFCILSRPLLVIHTQNFKVAYFHLVIIIIIMHSYWYYHNYNENQLRSMLIHLLFFSQNLHGNSHLDFSVVICLTNIWKIPLTDRVIASV